jgi:non-ribosomal peptide synthetase component F
MLGGVVDDDALRSAPAGDDEPRTSAAPVFGAAPEPGAGSAAGTPVGVGLVALADADPDAPAVTCGELTLTRAELVSRANRLARQLSRLGAGRGSMVTIGLPNGV